jgi:hypothetical protein
MHFYSRESSLDGVIMGLKMGVGNGIVDEIRQKQVPWAFTACDIFMELTIAFAIARIDRDQAAVRDTSATFFKQCTSNLKLPCEGARYNRIRLSQMRSLLCPYCDHCNLVLFDWR